MPDVDMQSGPSTIDPAGSTSAAAQVKDVKETNSSSLAFQFLCGPPRLTSRVLFTFRRRNCSCPHAG